MKLFAPILLLALPAALRGCDELRTPNFSEYTHIPPQGIPQGWEFEFNPMAPDAISADSAALAQGVHDVVVAIRYTNRSLARNVIINVEEMSLQHERPDSLSLTIPLFDSDGRPTGKGNFGVYELADTIRRGIPIPEGYTISLSSPLADSITSGISDIGIIIY